jgi:hypothetical protein
VKYVIAAIAATPKPRTLKLDLEESHATKFATISTKQIEVNIPAVIQCKILTWTAS